MDKETYEALKRIMEFTRGKNKELKNNDINQIETWIDEVAKEYTEDEQYPKCEGCGKPLLDGQMVIKGENRHSACA